MKWNAITIKSKLIFGFIIAVSLPLLITILMMASKSQTIIRENILNQLDAINSNKISGLNEIFVQWEIDIIAQQDRSIATKGMAAYESFLETGTKSPEYKRYAGIINGFVKTTGYHDYFVINNDGLCVYSDALESDYNTNLLTGKYKDSGLGRAVKSAIRGDVAFEDFTPYAPSGGEYAAFFAAPIIMKNKQIGVVALKIPIEKINNIVQNRVGMGETGETYLVGKVKNYSSYRCDRIINAGKVGDEKSSFILDKAFNGKTGQESIINKNGEAKYVAFSPIQSKWFDWVMISNVSVEEMDAALIKMRSFVLLIAFILLMIFIAFGYFLSVNIQKEITAIMKQIEVIVGNIFAGKLDSRGNVEKVGIDFKPVLLKINELIKVLVGFLDNVPVPLMMIDKDFDILYMNKAGCSVGDSSEDRLKGSKCYDYFKTDDCNTANCACKKAMISSQIESSAAEAHPADKDLYINYTGTPLKDQNGKVVGALEAILDSTESYNAMNLIKKQSKYQEGEVNKLVSNLSKVAEGDFTIDTEIAAHDTDTQDIATNFTNINTGLQNTVNNLNSIAGQFKEVSEAAEKGELKFRGRPDEYTGAYNNIVAIVNRVLDLVIEPVNEAISVMEKVADKNMSVRVDGDYKGDLDAFKNFINSAIGNLDIALAQVSDGVVQVSSASDQISKGSQSLAEGTNEQA
ncbi:MAG: PAS domain-containing protein, partial [Candidatus Marinimicrobia bacterium]|nr:PAS domain-containing protein [Candidatus Neomarinimicrobiota bacterium]